ncbi:MAG: hypothetical protein PHQ74_11295 [Crocinitomicaceae bacterium]|nr:hypothetical protein [Crocinitomicaceae bacterium]
MGILNLKNIIKFHASKSIFTPKVELLSDDDYAIIMNEFSYDYERYYSTTKIDPLKIQYFPGLLATFYYRISRYCFLENKEELAREFSSLSFSLTAIEIYYTAEIKRGLKINHGVATIIGARVKVGENVLLHHNVTFGDKNGGRPTIGNNVTIYPGSVIVGEIAIGDFSVIGANTFVDKSYPQYSKIY